MNKSRTKLIEKEFQEEQYFIERSLRPRPNQHKLKEVEAEIKGYLDQIHDLHWKARQLVLQSAHPAICLGLCLDKVRDYGGNENIADWAIENLDGIETSVEFFDQISCLLSREEEVERRESILNRFMVRNKVWERTASELPDTYRLPDHPTWDWDGFASAILNYLDDKKPVGAA